eukprot:scaffold130921_cov70-Phaeocystis_antarctica.AAC.2
MGGSLVYTSLVRPAQPHTGIVPVHDCGVRDSRWREFRARLPPGPRSHALPPASIAPRWTRTP